MSISHIAVSGYGTQQNRGTDGFVVVNVSDVDIVVSEFELQARNYVHFCTNTMGKSLITLIPQLGFK